jgi:uncharacterized protein (DUF488 family)
MSSNTILYTIGYRGRTPEELIETLEKHGIKVLIDIRHGKRARKGFTPTELREKLERHGITYISIPTLGVPRNVREPYIRGRIAHEHFREWYLSWIERNRSSWDPIIRKAREMGTIAIMCAERYPKPNNGQKHHCHRDLLADYLIEQGLFKKRIDIE